MRLVIVAGLLDLLAALTTVSQNASSSARTQRGGGGIRRQLVDCAVLHVDLLADSKNISSWRGM